MPRTDVTIAGKIPLNSWIYSRTAPPRTADPDVKAAWKWSVMSEILDMAHTKGRQELRRFLEFLFPDRDMKHVGAQDIILPDDRDPSKDKLLGQRLPRLGRAIAPTAVAANVPDAVEEVGAALLWLTGCSEALEPYVQIRVSGASGREIGEVLGRKHSQVFRAIRTQGEESRTLARIHRADPSEGAAKRGIDRETGRRRGTPAHPTNEYQLIITPNMLEKAGRLRERLGQPERPAAWEIVQEPQAAPQEASEAARCLRQLKEDLQAAGLTQVRVERLLQGLRGVAFDGRTLTLQGTVFPAAVEALELVSPYRLCFLLPPAQPAAVLAGAVPMRRTG